MDTEGTIKHNEHRVGSRCTEKKVFNVTVVEVIPIILQTNSKDKKTPTP